MKKFTIFFIFSIVAIAMSFSVQFVDEQVARAMEFANFYSQVFVDGGVCILENGELQPLDMEFDPQVYYTDTKNLVTVVNGGTLELHNMTASNIDSSDMAIIYIKDGTLRMLGGEFNNNTLQNSSTYPSIVWLDPYYDGKIDAEFDGVDISNNTQSSAVNLTSFSYNYNIVMKRVNFCGNGYGVGVSGDIDFDENSKNANIVLESGLIKGNGTGVYISAAAYFKMYGGEIIENNYSGIDFDHGSLEITGGEISHNSQEGIFMLGAVAEVILSGDAKIINNNDDGIWCGHCEFLTISDNAELSDNAGYGFFSSNGGITAEINGGKICNNSLGGFVIVGGTNTVTINDCEISGNTSTDGTIPSAFYVEGRNSVVTMNGGRIYGNTSENGYSCVVTGTFIMNGGEISSDTSASTRAYYFNIFQYKGGTIKGTITSNEITLFKQPESVLSIYAYSTSSGAKIVKLSGLSTIDLTKIKVTNSNRVLTYQTISGERWIVLGSTTSSFTTDGIIEMISNPWKVEAEENLNLEIETENLEPSTTPIAFVDDKKQKPNFAAIYDNKKFYLEPVRKSK